MVLIRVLLLVALAIACVPRAPIPQAPTKLPVAVVAVLGSVEDRAVQAAPAGLIERLNQSVTARNLSPVSVESRQLLAPFAERRATPQRLSLLAELSPDAALLLLVEAEARFYSQLEGRYRWTVAVHTSVAPRGQLESGVSSDVEVPVFLQFHHEREAEALSAAAPVIQRQVEALLDATVGGLPK